MSLRSFLTSPAFRKARIRAAVALALAGLTLPASVLADGPAAQPLPVPPSAANPKVYVVGYTHLDTQWRWSYPQVISVFLKNTMEDNFKDFEKYPHYVFNFTGSNRYMMMKEYFPEDYAKMTKYIKAGRWFPAGSSVEEGDVNMPNDEAIIRQVLYGNQFFRREFGVASEEFMLPDCFGFQASLPSILAHCGIKGFMTQKLTWGSAVGIPFNVGVWTGPDGKSVVAALNPGDYNGDLKTNLSKDKNALARVEKMGQEDGVYVDYHLYGTGDRGGAVRETSLKNLEAAYNDPGPLKVISAKADQMFKDLTPAQVSKLPVYKGDLLLTWHSAGSPTSQAFVKRTNRKLEQLGSAAERASVAADWLGSSPYPRQKIYDAWILQLGAHFHDIMAGTALPKAYEYSWNNMILSLNQWAAVATDGVGGVAQGMDTRGNGTPIVIYNPLATDRTDVACVEVPADSKFEVFGPDGKAIASQTMSESGKTKVLFQASVKSMGFSIYDLRPVVGAAMTKTAGEMDPTNNLSVTERTIENENLKVTLNDAGDIASVLDKKTGKEQLSAPARIEFLHEDPREYPAWNMDYEDRSAKPTGYVDGPCTFKIVENGPVRVAIQTEREAQGSKFVQTISLDAGAAGNSVRVESHIDWHTQKCSLEAVFPLTAGNPEASYESAVAVIKRGNNNPKKYEVPQQQWFDVTDESGKFGTAILNDCKYASDKPDDHTVRLTLLYTPGTRAGYQDQGTQDLGRHEMVYSIAPHDGGWEAGQVPWTAARLNQPLMTFATTQHDGPLGKTFSLGKADKEGVAISALKKAEDSDEYIVRLKELNGVDEGVTTVTLAGQILSAREVDGQEREIGPAKVEDGKLVASITPFSLRAFAVKLAPPATKVAPTQTAEVALTYNSDAISLAKSPADGSFDEQGKTYPGDMMPATITSENIPFKMGPHADGDKNVLVCQGQTISIPAGYDKFYILASSSKGDAPVDFTIGGKTQHVTVQDWTGMIGQWDNRIWAGVIPELTYNWANKFVGLDAGYIKRDTVAWFSSHRRDPEKGNEFYKFCYLFKYGFDVPAGATSITLPNDPSVKIFAATVSKNGHDTVTPARPLYDTLEDHVPSGPVISPTGGKFDNVTTFTMDHSSYGRAGDIHYTTDGSAPTESSPVYTGPVMVVKPTTVKARQFSPKGPAGPEVSAMFDVNDTTPPAVKSATGLTVEGRAAVAFTEPVTKESAENVDAYVFNPPVKVTKAVLSDEGDSVTLTLDKPLTDGAKLTINGVCDISPNANKVAATPVDVKVSGALVSIDAFDADGTKDKEMKVPSLSGKANAKWTINFFVKPDGDVPDLTPIAGFGSCKDGPDGKGRYICKFAEGVHFWACNRDVEGSSPVDVGAWQMLSASYDGKTLSLYKDGKLLNSKEIELADDQPTVRLAPADAWGEGRHFKGQIRSFTIWPTAMNTAAIESLKADMPKK